MNQTSWVVSFIVGKSRIIRIFKCCYHMRIISRYNFFITFIFFTSALLVADNKSDSLLSVTLNAKVDSIKFKAFLDLGIFYKNSNPDTAIHYLLNAVSLSQNLHDDFKLYEAKRQVGWCLRNKAEYNKALMTYQEILTSLEKHLQIPNNILKSKKMFAAVLNNIGAVYDEQGNYVQALAQYFKALKIAEEINDKNKIASILGNIGSVFQKKGEFTKALSYFFKSLKMAEILNDANIQAVAISNIGIVFKQQADGFTNPSEKEKYYQNALEYYHKGLEMAKKLSNKASMATNYGNIGNTISAQAKLKQDKKIRNEYLKKSLEFHINALEITNNLGIKEGSARHLENIGTVYLNLGDFKAAERNLLHSASLNQEIGAKANLLSNERELTHLYDTLKDFKKALVHYKNYILAKETVSNSENEKKLMQLEMTVKFDKQQVADSIRNAEKLAKEQIKHEHEIKTQRNVTYGGIIGFFLMLIISITNYRAYKQKQKAAEIISSQKRIVEEKQKEILDSIHYAKRIQSAILPSNEEWKFFLPESFILYLPKDIVAGDFYWLESLVDQNKKTVMFAAADCTGHGVPGALVSLVCGNALSKSVLEDKISDPAKILDRTRDIVIEKLSKGQADVKDGMDISLCLLQNNTLTWAGANNPLWIIKNKMNKFIEVTAEKQPIGKHIEHKPFHSHTLELEKGDMVYLFTDGFADQFGGPKGKKFKYKPFKELLLSIHKMDLDEQKKVLITQFNAWKGELEQVDDICIIGVRI